MIAISIIFYISAASPVIGGSECVKKPNWMKSNFYEIAFALDEATKDIDLDSNKLMHPLGKNAYGSVIKIHGGEPSSQYSKNWNDYDTWEELMANTTASEKYLSIRAEMLNNRDFEFKPVLSKVLPLLKEKHEYIGLISMSGDHNKDPYTLDIECMEASKIKIGHYPGTQNVAAVEVELVAKYANKPSLFIFHTHPDDELASALPSSNDLAFAIRLSAASRFVASVLISKYGVFVYGLSWEGYKAIHTTKNKKLALLNYVHDVVTAYESIRSWKEYSIQDVLDFFPKYMMFMQVYPSRKMISDMVNTTIHNNLDDPSNLDLIDDIRREIYEYSKSKKTKRKRKLWKKIN